MTQRKSYKDIVNQEVPVLVDFFAEWCGPCKAMMPVLKELYSEVKGKAKIIKIDIDKNKALAQKLGIRGVPTFVLYKEGNEVWRKSGMQTMHALQEVIEKAS